MRSHVFCDLNNIFINLINILKLRGPIMPDAKEWEKASLNLVKTRNWLYKFHDEYEQDHEINEDITVIRYMIGNCIEIMDKLAKWDDKGWFKVPGDEE